MNESKNPPAGWSVSEFQAICADVGSWTWGTVQGAFNEKASVTQIIVDAVIGMIPLLGDVTAVRDLIAVLIGMSDDEEKRHSTWQWVLLVVLLFALFPVFGGVVKGVGRLAIKTVQEAAHLAGTARVAHLANGAKEIIEFLNRIGVKDSEKWFLTLRVTEHVAPLIAKLNGLLMVLDTIFSKTAAKLTGVAPGLVARINALRLGLSKVRELAGDKIPKAVKELDQQLRELQSYVRSGGETTSRLALHEVATGQRVTTRAEERRLIEDGVLPARNSRGGFDQNPSLPRDKGKIEKLYTSLAGYPDMLHMVDPGTGAYSNVAAYAGRMVNRQLKNDEVIYRFFGPKRTTRGFPVGETSASGAWWGLGAAPKSAEEWRELAAVLDSYNGDGFFVSAKVIGNKGPKAVVGTVSEQFGSNIPGQYLPGGKTQAFFFLERNFSEILKQAGHDFINGGTLSRIFDPTTGMEFIFHKTGWTDANGVWGYFEGLSSATIQTARVGSREAASKRNEEVVIHP